MLENQEICKVWAPYPSPLPPRLVCAKTVEIKVKWHSKTYLQRKWTWFEKSTS